MNSSMSEAAEIALRKYLLAHESWIALGLEDFGDLRLVFREVIGHEPREINA